MNGAGIPILTYHRIADCERLNTSIFESHLEVLAASGIPSLLPKDLGRAGRGFMLTFDDGFADCWTHVFPLLKKYGVRAVIFVIPAILGEGPERVQGKRVYHDDASQAHQEASVALAPHQAFLRWSELTAMEKSGLVAVQSHSLEHRSIWGGDQITGFNLGSGNRTHWSLEQITGGDIRWGIPVYRRISALANRRFDDNRNLRDLLAGWLETRGGAAYVGERGLEKTESELWALLRSYESKNSIKGVWETIDERVKRTTADIAGARQVLEKRLGGTRDELCLPWGEYDSVTLECARKAGVRRMYTLDRGPNPAVNPGFLLNRFEPRPRGRFWLKSRLWIYTSTLRSRLYAKLSSRGR